MWRLRYPWTFSTCWSCCECSHPEKYAAANRSHTALKPRVASAQPRPRLNQRRRLSWSQPQLHLPTPRVEHGFPAARATVIL